MKNIKKSISLIILLGLVLGCNFLDVVPNDTPNLDSAFSNRTTTERFLRTCYSYLPDPLNGSYYPTWFTSRDEFDVNMGYYNLTRQTAAAKIAQGEQNTNSPYLDYWSGRNGGKALYQGIRYCNMFLENVDKPYDLKEDEKTRWVAEVKFLKAYYHFFLMELYGPVALVDENLPTSASPEETMVYREPIDDCVAFIVKLLDEAIADLPVTLPDQTSEQGRINKLIAMGVKAKVLAWAASPIFNGNPDYRNWIDNKGRHLIPQEADPAKWAKAAEAAKEAIDACHANGFKLYEFNRQTSPSTYRMNDTLVTMMTIRKAITEDVDRNPGVIWASQEIWGDRPGNESGFERNLMRQFLPQLYISDMTAYIGRFYASWHMCELFYSNHGVPIDEDRGFDYSGRFNTHKATAEDKHESYIATGETTVNINFNREPRFYADLGFDRGYFELASTTSNGGGSFSPMLRLREGEIFNGSLGYVVKKLVAFESSGTQGVDGRSISIHDYRYPLLRLADLYLLYSECLNESLSQPSAEVYEYIDKVREAAGLQGVLESWGAYSMNPDKPKTQAGMRAIIQRERLIELAFEGQRFFDLRRWKIAADYWNLPPTKYNNSRSDINLTYKPVVYDDGRKVKATYRDYLFPIREADLQVNKNLVQTYGW